MGKKYDLDRYKAYHGTYGDYVKWLKNLKKYGLSDGRKARFENTLIRINYLAIVYMREIQGRTLREIGFMFGITGERVRQLTMKQPTDDDLPIWRE